MVEEKSLIKRLVRDRAVVMYIGPANACALWIPMKLALTEVEKVSLGSDLISKHFGVHVMRPDRGVYQNDGSYSNTLVA